MKNAIGFNQGQYGDVIMGVVAAKAFKRDNPYARLTAGINKKYASVAPFLMDNKYFDDVHIWDEYNDWPSMQDRMNGARYDKVFNPMPQHTRHDWYMHMHQTEEMCYMHGLEPPHDLSVELKRMKDIARKNKTIAVCFFGETRGSDKNPSIEKAERICGDLTKLGYSVVQVGLPTEKQVAANRFTGAFYDTVKMVLGCDLLITVDTAISWIASGFNHPVLGLYSYSYYYNATTSKNWQPVNKNAIYLEAPRVEEINEELIIKTVKLLA